MTAAAALAADVQPPPQAPCIPDDFLDDEDIPVVMAAEAEAQEGGIRAVVPSAAAPPRGSRLRACRWLALVRHHAGFSWDEPRVSWDGYLFGPGAGTGLGRAPPPLPRLPPILSVLEDTRTDIVERSDGEIPVEDDFDPEPSGGSLQTRDAGRGGGPGRCRQAFPVGGA